jgi:hypothetical protein
MMDAYNNAELPFLIIEFVLTTFIFNYEDAAWVISIPFLLISATIGFDKLKSEILNGCGSIKRLSSVLNCIN